MDRFVSEMQRRKFVKLEREGKISKETLRRLEEATGRRKLPDRITPK